MPNEAQLNESSNVVSFERGAHVMKLRAELGEWRTRLRLAFERDWSVVARQIIEFEIARRRRELDERTRWH